MDAFKAEFQAIDSDAALRAFVAKYRLSDGASPDFNPHIFQLAYEHGHITVLHRYRDPSGPGQILADENTVTIIWKDNAGNVGWQLSVVYVG